MFTTAIILAAAMVAAFLLTLARMIGWGTILRNATFFDVVFTVGAVAVMSGTLMGGIVAILAGLILAIFLTVVKNTLSFWNRTLCARTAFRNKLNAAGTRYAHQGFTQSYAY